MASIGSCGVPSPASLPEDTETLGAVHPGILVFSLISLEMLIGMSFHCSDHSKLEEETCDKMTTSYFVLVYQMLVFTLFCKPHSHQLLGERFHFSGPK